jgi:hypothetical protein
MKETFDEEDNTLRRYNPSNTGNSFPNAVQKVLEPPLTFQIADKR